MPTSQAAKIQAPIKLHGGAFDGLEAVVTYEGKIGKPPQVVHMSHGKRVMDKVLVHLYKTIAVDHFGTFHYIFSEWTLERWVQSDR